MRLSALLLLTLSSPLAAAEDGWRYTALDTHEPRIDQAHPRALAALEGLAADAYGREELPKVRALLAAPVKDAPVLTLVGKWRCSSTQIGRDGIFAYPNFRCEIRLAEDGTLEFSKLSGSQRRYGQIFPFTEHGWVLLGVSYVNDDPYRAYSATLPDSTEADLAADTVGLLETLKDGRVRILLDAEADRVELYTLSRDRAADSAR